MRNSKRIPIVLDLFLNKEKLINFLGTPTQKEIDYIYNNWELVEKEWKENPDLRFGQLLCNLRLITSYTIENKIMFSIWSVFKFLNNSYLVVLRNFLFLK